MCSKINNIVLYLQKTKFLLLKPTVNKEIRPHWIKNEDDGKSKNNPRGLSNPKKSKYVPQREVGKFAESM